ncbi:MAG: hypothetical protein R2942_03705 [Ignavibacteria bacterium]
MIGFSSLSVDETKITSSGVWIRIFREWILRFITFSYSILVLSMADFTLSVLLCEKIWLGLKKKINNIKK